MPNEKRLDFYCLNHVNKTAVNSDVLNEKYTVYEHKNGFKSYVCSKDMSVTYALLCVQFGASDCEYTDADGDHIILPDGSAHFLEHKMFENPDGSDSFEHFSTLGADSNAYTSNNRTVYLFNCTENFDDCLDELLKMVFNPSFKAESVERERGIIAQEILMYSDNPYNRCYELLMQAMYSKNPVRKNICGSVESIENISPDILYKCWHDFYVPSNMVLSVCGNVSPDHVKDIVDRFFEVFLQMPDNVDSKPVAVSKCIEPCAVNKAFVSENMSVSRPILCLGYKISDLETDAYERQKREIALLILSELLFSHSGELYNDLYDNNMISSWFSASVSYNKQFANVTIGTETDKPEYVADEIKSYVKKVQQCGISDMDFERCRRVVYSEYVGLFDSTEEIAEALADSALGNNSLFDYPEIAENISKEYVEKIFRMFLSREYTCISVIFPETTV